MTAQTGIRAGQAASQEGCAMDRGLFKEIVERKAAYYVRLGCDFAEAANRAVCELLAGAYDRQSPVGMFCLRACLVGAGRECRLACDHPECN